MDEIITLASDEEDKDSTSPPRKRIKPILLTNLPNVSLIKIPNQREIENKQDIVVLSSDESDSEINQEIKEKVNCTDVKEVVEKDAANNDVIQIEDDLDNTIEIIDNDNELTCTFVKKSTADINNESTGDIELIKTLEDSFEIINADSDEENTTRINTKDGTSRLDQPQPEPSGSNNKPPNTILLEEFLKVIEEKTKNEKYSVIIEKIALLLNYYRKREDTLGNSNTFKNLLLPSTENAKKTEALAVKSFYDVYQHVKERVNTESIEVEEHNIPKIQKLEKTIKQLVKMIKNLEEEEIDFDEEENSSFLKLERYISRLDKLYKVYCGFLKKNPYNGRLTYSKLDFVDSEYNEINRAISKAYNNKKFPSYYEMETFIGKVVKDNNMALNEESIKKESIHCFKRLGELLQNRRRKELYDSHIMLIKDTDDPAKEDSELSTVLKRNYTEGQQKLEKLVEGYVFKQENKLESSATSSGDDSDNNSSSVNSEDSEENDNCK